MRDVKEEICVIVLLADVRLGDRVDLVGGRDLEAEQDELARVGGRLGGEVDVGVLLKHRLEVRGEGGLGVNGKGRVGRVPGGDDVSPLDGVGLNGMAVPACSIMMSLSLMCSESVKKLRLVERACEAPSAYLTLTGVAL